MAAGAPSKRVDQKEILAVCTFTHINTRLLLVGKPFPEEVAASNFLQRVIGFNGEEFSNTCTNVVASWNAVEIIVGVESLFFDPAAGPRRILVFEPPIRVRHGYAVQDFSYWLLFRQGRGVQTRVHSRLLFSRASTSRFMRRTKLRK